MNCQSPINLLYEELGLKVPLVLEHSQRLVYVTSGRWRSETDIQRKQVP